MVLDVFCCESQLSFSEFESENIITVPDSISAGPPAPPALLVAVPGYPPQPGSSPVTGSLPVRISILSATVALASRYAATLPLAICTG